jgi:hypothetical protein
MGFFWLYESRFCKRLLQTLKNTLEHQQEWFASPL